jgi:hypothetical protein
MDLVRNPRRAIFCNRLHTVPYVKENRHETNAIFFVECS